MSTIVSARSITSEHGQNAVSSMHDLGGHLSGPDSAAASMLRVGENTVKAERGVVGTDADPCRQPPSEECTDQLRAFTTTNTSGFFVGKSGALKWITQELGKLKHAMVEESAPVEGRPWPVAIDIGAGKYGPMGSIDDSDSLLLLPVLCDGSRECQIHAVEAIPIKAEQLEEEAARRPSTAPYKHHLHWHAAGFGAVESNMTMIPSGQAASMNNYKIVASVDNVPDELKQHAFQVPVHTMDAFLERHGLVKVDAVFYVKVDIEGGEFDVFRGSARALEVGAIQFLSFEYGFQWSPEYRDASLSFGQRVHRWNREPKIKSHSGAWEYGPTVPLDSYKGATLDKVVSMFDGFGYDVYMLNSRGLHEPPVLVPVGAGFFLHPHSELCAHDPFIFLDVEKEEYSAREVMRDLNCWTDAFAVRRGAPKRAFLSVFGGPTALQFPACTCI